MRLIDADELLKYMEITEIRQYIDEINKGNDNYSSTDLYDYIKEQPIAYDVDKVVEQLKKMRSKREEQLRICADNDSADYLRCKMSAIADVIKIVKSGGIG